MRRILFATILIASATVPLTGCDLTDWLGLRLPGGENGNGGLLSGSVLFFDDFNEGHRPAWFAKHGEPKTENGRFVGGGEFYVRTQDSTSWQNYAIDVDIFKLESGRTFFGPFRNYLELIFRSRDFKRGIVIRFEVDRITWHLYDGESGKFDDGSGEINVTLSDQVHVKVEAVGPRYNIYVRQQEGGQLVRVGSFDEGTILSGMPGVHIFDPPDPVMHLLRPPAIDNFRVSSR